MADVMSVMWTSDSHSKTVVCQLSPTVRPTAQAISALDVTLYTDFQLDNVFWSSKTAKSTIPKTLAIFVAEF